MVRVRVLVSGVVQGVGFRFFTRSVARQFRIHGFVRNLPDASVEIEAQGEREQIGRFLKAVRTGPSSAQVSGIDVEEIDLGDYSNEFEVRF